MPLYYLNQTRKFVRGVRKLLRQATNMNTTENGSICSNLQLNSNAAKIGKTFGLCLLLVVSLVGNTLVTIIVYRTQTLRKAINFFIVNMAISDLLFPTFVFPWSLTLMHMVSDSRPDWPLDGFFGQATCKLNFFLPSVSIAVSVQSMVLIAIDRYRAVAFPLRSPYISSKMCFFLILCTWIVAMAVSCPFFVSFKLVKRADKLVCGMKILESSPEGAVYVLAWYTMFYYIPVVLLVVIYSIIVIKLKTQTFPGEQTVNARQQRARRNHNVLKMAIAILLAFALCCLPWSFLTMFFYSAGNTVNSLPCGVFIYYDIAFYLALSNCAINPVICFIFCRNYREGFKRLFKCFGTNQE